jgi:hypothetical protein
VHSAVIADEEERRHVLLSSGFLAWLLRNDRGKAPPSSGDVLRGTAKGTLVSDRFRIVPAIRSCSKITVA